MMIRQCGCAAPFALGDVMTPQIAEDISRILAMREMELKNVRESLDAGAHASELNRRHGEILGRIRLFFGLH